MPNKMLIDASHPEETRVVVVRGNRIEEFDFESQDKKQLKGNIYLARVTRVEPSLQAAFVEYGGNRHGFLAFSEIHPDYYQIPVADRQALLRAEAEAAEAEDDEDGDGDERGSRIAAGAGAAAASTAAATIAARPQVPPKAPKMARKAAATRTVATSPPARKATITTSITTTMMRATTPTARPLPPNKGKAKPTTMDRLLSTMAKAILPTAKIPSMPRSAATRRHRRSPQASTAM